MAATFILSSNQKPKVEWENIDHLIPPSSKGWENEEWFLSSRDWKPIPESIASPNPSLHQQTLAVTPHPVVTTAHQ